MIRVFFLQILEGHVPLGNFVTVGSDFPGFDSPQVPQNGKKHNHKLGRAWLSSPLLRCSFMTCCRRWSPKKIGSPILLWDVFSKFPNFFTGYSCHPSLFNHFKTIGNSARFFFKHFFPENRRKAPGAFDHGHGRGRGGLRSQLHGQRR